MNIDVAYGRELNDDILQQLQYMEADAFAYYESIDSDENEYIIGAIPSETFKQFKRRTVNTLFLMKIKKTKQHKSKLVGMACLSKHSKTEKILHTVFVKNAYRRKGIGEAIVKKAISIAKKMKCSVKLGVNPLNTNAINLYTKLGFKICKSQSIHMKLK